MRHRTRQDEFYLHRSSIYLGLLITNIWRQIMPTIRPPCLMQCPNKLETEREYKSLMYSLECLSNSCKSSILEHHRFPVADVQIVVVIRPARRPTGPLCAHRESLWLPTCRTTTTTDDQLQGETRSLLQVKRANKWNEMRWYWWHALHIKYYLRI